MRLKVRSEGLGDVLCFGSSEWLPAYKRAATGAGVTQSAREVTGGPLSRPKPIKAASLEPNAVAAWRSPIHTALFQRNTRFAGVVEVTSLLLL